MYKRCSEVCFCLRIGFVLDSTTSAEKKSSSVESEDLLGALLKVSDFAWYNEVFLLGRTNRSTIVK